MGIEFSAQQSEAIEKVSIWHNQCAGGPGTFYLAGYAGTGKTTIARHLAEAIDGAAVYAAFTGKAASVMRKSGCTNAQTIHSLMYTAEIDEKTGQASFTWNEDSPFATAGLIVIDECSMVGLELASDLLKYERPILVLGDPAQLPPVGKDTGFFTSGEPDIMLTEIHRQAAENPIIQLATAIRNGESIDRLAQSEQCRVVHETTTEFRREVCLEADQIIVGTRNRRSFYNTSMRRALGHEGEAPVVEDKLVCRKNDRNLGIFNGGSFVCSKFVKKEGPELTFEVMDPDTEREVKVATRIECIREGVEAMRDLPYEQTMGLQAFEFAYALTGHLSQGSQWDSIVVFDDSRIFREKAQAWLYTAATRAAEKLIIIR